MPTLNEGNRQPGVPHFVEFDDYLDPVVSGMRELACSQAEIKLGDLTRQMEAAKQDPQGKPGDADQIKRAKLQFFQAQRVFLWTSIQELRNQIVHKLAEVESRAPNKDDAKENWVSATKAAEIAKRFNVKLRLPDITKLSGRKNPPFRSRSVGKNRREVHLPSFVLYLDDRITTKPDFDAELEDIEARKKAARKKKISKIRQHRE